jgi:hypothetical protein
METRPWRLAAHLAVVLCAAAQSLAVLYFYGPVGLLRWWGGDLFGGVVFAVLLGTLVGAWVLVSDRLHQRQ